MILVRAWGRRAVFSRGGAKKLTILLLDGVGIIWAGLVQCFCTFKSVEVVD